MVTEFACRIKVSDNWHPTKDDGTVRLSFNRDTKRMALSGEDDFMMAKETGTVEEYRKLSRSKSPMSQSMAKSMGFKED